MWACEAIKGQGDQPIFDMGMINSDSAMMNTVIQHLHLAIALVTCPMTDS
jgi:hypothetical protein